MTAESTIFALATPPGKSGVAVVRVSGPEALTTLQQLTGKQDWQPNHLVYSVIRHPSSVIDHAMAVYFKAPASFTGDDVAEFHLHGSLAVIQSLLAALGDISGLRPAERGEFTRRALLNGKMDLTQAEAVADLIEAETEAQTTQALRQLQGSMSEAYGALRHAILVALAHLEAYIDFPDEEIPASVWENLGGEVGAVQSRIQAILAQGRRGERIRDGINIVILGAPNAGKSSLLNRLAGREVAIVSHRAGTTRDMIEVHLNLRGYPVIVVDTAGLRESDDDIESEGIRRARARAESADIMLLLLDATDEGANEATRSLMNEKSLVVINKCDLAAQSPRGVLAISAATGEGVDRLITQLEERVIALMTGEGALVTRQRHRLCLEAAQARLSAFFDDLPLELKCEELRLAASAIGQITGKIHVDDVLDLIFREFCIGK